MILKTQEDAIKVTKMQFKVSKQSKKLSAFKMSYSHGVEGSLMKAKDETEDEMQVCTLKKKQVIDKLFEKRINQTTIATIAGIILSAPLRYWPRIQMVSCRPFKFQTGNN